jgi:hypothetical protein
MAAVMNPYMPVDVDILRLALLNPTITPDLISHTQQLNNVGAVTTNLIIQPLIAGIQGNDNSLSSLVLISITEETHMPHVVTPIFSCLLTGDATHQTFREFNIHFNPNPFGLEFKYITIPHHGSIATMNAGTDINPDFSALHGFLNRYQHHAALASGQAGNYRHPNRRIMYAFWNKVSMPRNPNPAVTYQGTGVAGANVSVFPVLLGDPPQSPAPNPPAIAAAVLHHNFVWDNGVTRITEQCNNHLYSTKTTYNTAIARNLHLTCSNVAGVAPITLDNKEFIPQF